jgi:putative ABC transport system permease protein
MYFKMVSGSIIRRRSRMVVAFLAVAIGATILSGLITIYYDIPRQMGQEFRSYGANMILVPEADGAEADGVLTDDTVRQVRGCLDAEELVGMAPYKYEIIKINEQPFMAAGTDLAEAKKTSPYWYVTGNWPVRPDEALIGKEISNAIRIVPGDRFEISGTDANGGIFTAAFQVSGVVETGGSEEAFVFMAGQALFDIIKEPVSYDVVECSVSASSARLGEIRDMIEANTAGVSPRLVQKITQSEGTVLTKLQALVYLVTLVVLVLTMICVATTMMAVVTERRKEIGLRKALGASNGSIIAEFFGEAIFIGILGGILGVVLGYFFAQFVGSNVFGRDISMRPLLIPATLLVSVLITALACIIPVRRATDVDPAVVLKGE